MNLFNLKDEISKTVTIKDVKFNIKAILPNERVEIATKEAYLRNGMNIESFSFDRNIYISKLATIDVCCEFPIEEIKDSKGKPVKQAREIPDTTLIDALFEEIDSLTEDLELKLKKNKSLK